MKPKKKNNVLTFFCSFVPGAAEMYMGFMKMGFSMIILFMVSVMFMDMLGSRFTFGILAAFWFYCFFHALNFISLTPEEFDVMEDRFIWEDVLGSNPVKISNKSIQRWMGVMLIVVGLGTLWNTFERVIYNYIPDYLWDTYYSVVVRIPSILLAVIFIIIGFRLIFAKRKELEVAEKEIEADKSGM